MMASRQCQIFIEGLKKRAVETGRHDGLQPHGAVVLLDEVEPDWLW